MLVKAMRVLYRAIRRKRLKNKDITLISSNCNGGVILHDLGLQFNSPFVNLWMEPKDFLKVCENLEYYMSCPLKFIKGVRDYPVGVIDDVKLYFKHYKSEDEAYSSWMRRKQRMDYDNLFFLFSDRNGCVYEDLVRFDALKYKNKIAFTNKEYPELSSTFYIRGFENEESVGICSRYRNEGYKRYFDEFDYIEWFNGGKLRQLPRLNQPR